MTKLCSLAIKFNTYKKSAEHTMKKYLVEMANIITKLNDEEHELNKEQKVNAIICFFSEQMLAYEVTSD